MTHIEMILSAFGVASFGKFIVDFLVVAAILALPFLIGVIYGDGVAHFEKEQEASHRRVADQDMLRRRQEHFRDMLRLMVINDRAGAYGM